MLIGQPRSPEDDKNTKSYNDTRSLDLFARKMQQKVVSKTLIEKWNNGKMGIKTYRLFGNDLYNIDLEDKDAYVDQCSQLLDGSDSGADTS